MSITKKFFFILIGTLLPATVLILIFELSIQKLVGLGDPIVYDASSTWGYSPRANRKYKRFSGSVVSINDAGLRSTKSWKETRSKKLVFLGDSVTYGGSYISDDETFSELVCQELTQPCFNGGVNAYGVINMVARSRFDSRISDADAVVFVVISGDFLRSFKRSSTAHFSPREPPRILPASWELLNFLSARYELKKLFGKNKIKNFLILKSN